jgi:hypothetical protein
MFSEDINAEIHPHDAPTEPIPRASRRLTLSANSLIERGEPSEDERQGFVAQLDSAVILLICSLVACLIIVMLAVVMITQLRNAASAGLGGLTSTVLHGRAAATATPSPTPSSSASSANAAAFLSSDTTSQGTWQGKFGGAGYSLVADGQQLPSTIQITPAGQSEYTWAASSADPRALQKTSTPGDRIAACWYSATTFTIDINMSDGQPHQLALYLLDWDQQNRVETLNVLDATTNTLLDARSVTAFAGSEYLVWQVRGHIILQVTNGPGSINAVVSGLFFT